jgi:hypothetical protein
VQTLTAAALVWIETLHVENAKLSEKNTRAVDRRLFPAEVESILFEDGAWPIYVVLRLICYSAVSRERHHVRWSDDV